MSLMLSPTKAIRLNKGCQPASASVDLDHGRDVVLQLDQDLLQLLWLLHSLCWLQGTFESRHLLLYLPKRQTRRGQ